MTPCQAALTATNPYVEASRRLVQLRQKGVPLLPIKAPPHYRALVEHEIERIGEGGPLYSVVYPKADRFDTYSPGEVVNFVEDFSHMPKGLERVIVHRYPKKLLYFPTDTCIGHCQYCFRPDITGTEPAQKNRHRNTRDEVMDRVVDYLHAHPQVQEVIFSGGDPLAVKPAVLDRVLERLLEVPTVRWCRFHTKAPIFAPSLLSEPLLNVVEKHDVRLVLHLVHPYELTEELARRLRRARRRGIWLYNQFPLLRGINDHAKLIMELAYRCNAVGVQMLTMFIADPIRYGATYRLRLQRVFDIADQVFREGEAWISNFRVCLDSPIGKLKREHITAHDPEGNLYSFERAGQQLTYHDIPSEMDEPSDLSQLLYDGADHVTL
jgi:lysine 2,3-aminomutase